MSTLSCCMLRDPYGVITVPLTFDLSKTKAARDTSGPLSRRRYQSSNGSFCQVTLAKCSVLLSLRFDIVFDIRSAITGQR